MKQSKNLAAGRITKERVFGYWFDQENGRRSPYIDKCGEYNITQMGEDAATYFCVETEFGNSRIETAIFDWAVEFSTYKGVFPNL